MCHNRSSRFMCRCNAGSNRPRTVEIAWRDTARVDGRQRSKGAVHDNGPPRTCGIAGDLTKRTDGGCAATTSVCGRRDSEPRECLLSSYASVASRLERASDDSLEESQPASLSRRMTMLLLRCRVRPSRGRSGAAALSVCLMLVALPLLARCPAVRFDTASLVSCRDVTTEEFSAANPQERLIEGRFHVTAMVDGQLPDDTYYMYRFQCPAGGLRVVDYQPRTRQATAAAGNVVVEKKKDVSKSLGVSVSGSFESMLSGTAGSDVGSKDASSIRYELKPPMEVVLVAGTVERGTGVYFKLLSSPGRSLEGSREFTVVMRVPQSWRGDVMYVRCEAQRDRRDKLVSCGGSRFVVGLHAAGDQEAKLAAEELVLAEAMLRRTVARDEREIRKRSLPSLAYRIGALFDIVDPRIPETWLDRFIFGSTRVSQHDVYGHLPGSVRGVADRYRRAKRKMYELNGSQLVTEFREAETRENRASVNAKAVADPGVL